VLPRHPGHGGSVSPRPGLQGCSYCLELDQRGRQVLHDLSGDDLRGGQVVEVLQGLVAQPGDGEVGLVAGDQLVIGERPEPFGLDAFRPGLPGRLALDELIQVHQAKWVRVE
jgi:hypothetical protein